MAGASLLTLLDDIATLLDDVALMTKKATAKTAGVLGDDLALNANQLTGLRAERELPVIWTVAKGSARNKLILVPAALAISALAPWAVLPLLMLGGLYLCFEGVEKLAHRWLHPPAERSAEHRAMLEAAARSAEDLLAFERDKIRGAIRTDFILSAEIIVIALGTVAAEPFLTRLLVLSAIAALMTVFVYGLVAGIVKIDDAGAALARRPGALAQRCGHLLLAAAPRLMTLLSVLGTAAMFLVGGGILVHGLAPVEHAFAAWAVLPPGWTLGGLAPLLLSSLYNALFGILCGAAVLLAVLGWQRLRGAAHA